MPTKSEQPGRPELTEVKAEVILAELLENPINAFLLKHEDNRKFIENTDSAIEALNFARKLIEERVENSIVFDSIIGDEGFDKIRANAAGILRTIESIERNKETIGEGQDAIVVIDKNEIKEFPPEVCYKFSKHEVTRRGRNTLAQEAELQQHFYDVANMVETVVGIPEPFYALDIGEQKIFAMERLRAVTVDEINRGVKRLPEWIDIDAVCDELEAFIDLLNHNSLYHRDLHPGNVMIGVDEPDEISQKVVFLIDFGLSAQGGDMDPYRKETPQGVFTYNDDCVMIKEIRKMLKYVRAYQERSHDNGN